MLTAPLDVLAQFPIRKSKRQKQAFRAAVQSYAAGLGYSYTEELGSMGARNLVIGDPELAKYLVTAHYDTCARLPIPNLITPCNFWCFILYQILLAVIMVVPPLLIGWVLGMLIGEPRLGLLMGYLLICVNIGMMLFGPANPRNANDNTSGVVTLLEIARTFPEKQRNKVCFVLFDLEEAGLIGSASYRRKHRKAAEKQIVFNLDCVGDGDHLLLFPTKKLKKDRQKLTTLYKACGYFGRKRILVQEKGFSVYPSDQANFPYGVGICALRRKKNLLYMSRIHTPKDTQLDETNVNLLRAALTTYICCDAAQ